MSFVMAMIIDATVKTTMRACIQIQKGLIAIRG